MPSDLQTWKIGLDVAASLTVMMAAAAGAIKYRLFNLFGHRWESSLITSDHRLESGRLLFVAEYKVVNTGQRPLRIDKIKVSLMTARHDKLTQILTPNRDALLATREIPDDVSTPGNLDVQPGERSIFTLRCQFDEMPEVTFIECKITFPHDRSAAVYVGLHVRQSKGVEPQIQRASATL